MSGSATGAVEIAALRAFIIGCPRPPDVVSVTDLIILTGGMAGLARLPATIVAGVDHFGQQMGLNWAISWRRPGRGMAKLTFSPALT